MKKLLSVLLVAAMPVLASNTTTIERGFKESNINDLQAMLLAKVVKSFGYTCRSISAASQSQWSGNYKLICNDYKYVYHIKDVGGRIVVEVD